MIALFCSGCASIQDLWNGVKNHWSSTLSASDVETIYLEAAQQFFAAVEGGDSGAVRDCFSINAQRADPEMEKQIERLTVLLSGPITLKNGEHLLLHGSYSNDHGKKISSVEHTLIITCGENSFWCDMGLNYRDDTDRDNVGITYINVKTTAFECAWRSDTWHSQNEYVEMYDVQSPGLRVLTEEQLKRPIEGEIRIINGAPRVYTPAVVLNESEVVDFLQHGASYTDFTKQFGSGCSGWNHEYYELPPIDGAPRYLCLTWDEEQNEIYAASVCDEWDTLRVVWKQEKE